MPHIASVESNVNVIKVSMYNVFVHIQVQHWGPCDGEHCLEKFSTCLICFNAAGMCRSNFKRWSKLLQSILFTKRIVQCWKTIRLDICVGYCRRSNLTVLEFLSSCIGRYVNWYVISSPYLSIPWSWVHLKHSTKHLNPLIRISRPQGAVERLRFGRLQ